MAQLGAAAAGDLNSHTGDKNNPHVVTAAQIGAYTKSEVDSKVAVVSADLAGHLAHKANPHAVTTTQIGAAPATRKISLSGGLLTGGGDLSADRTLGLDIASAAETAALTINNKAVTPLGLATLAAGKAAAGHTHTTAQVTGLDTALAAKAASARKINTAAPLSGGGDLSADRTLGINPASTAAIGAVQLATSAEVSALSNSTKAITPAGLAALADSKQNIGNFPHISADTDLTPSAYPQGGVIYLNTPNVTLTLDPDNEYPSYTRFDIHGTQPGSKIVNPNGNIYLRGDEISEVGAGVAFTIPYRFMGYLRKVTAPSANWHLSLKYQLPPTRKINTTSPLTGGGDLSADRTLAISAASASDRGAVQLATAAEAAAGTDAVKAVTPAGLKAAFTAANLGFTQSLAQTGWTKLPNGLILQWGRTGSIDSDTSITITFPITFPTACYQIIGSTINSRTPHDEIFFRAVSFTASQAVVVADTVPDANYGGTRYIQWLALGR